MKQKELFWIAVTIFITIVSWMILDIYRAKTLITVESELKSLETVNFIMKPEVLQTLKERAL